jgi:dipeptidyl aminopeptidase/acylaminoacyl peptidase
MLRRKPNGLWIVDVRTERAQELPVGGLHVLSVRWSPDGSQLLLVTAARPVTDEEQLRPKLMVASTAGGEPVLYCPTLGKISGADWSPDGRSIAFMGSVAAESDFYPGGLFVCRGPSSTPRNLNPDSPYSLENFRWSGARESMLVTVARGAHRYLARLSPAEPLPVRITDPAWEVQYRSDYSASSDGKRTALVLAKYNVPPDVWLLDGDGGKRQITHLNPELEQRVYGEGSEVRWKARDGLEISGVRILPVGYKKGVRYPMVVHLHGSNVGEINDFQASSMHWGQMLAAKGFAVLIPNYRGSLTDGPKFMRASKHDWGGKDMLDVLDGVDAMVREGLADPDRLGISGISYGGYLTARTITQTTRFRAAALVSGISNWVGIHTGQTAAPESAHKIEWVENPFDIANLLWDRSPTAHVRNVKSATLIMWGEFDYAIPLSQAIELFRGLRHFGVPSKLVVYPRDGHVPRETNHMRDMLGRAVSWFQQYLLN